MVSLGAVLPPSPSVTLLSTLHSVDDNAFIGERRLWRSISIDVKLTSTLWSDRVRRFEIKFAEYDNIFCKISLLIR